MTGERLDDILERALFALEEQDWSQAQSLLAERLDQTPQLGQRRLTLFLLSIAAARSGHTHEGEEFTKLAAATPLELGAPRYLNRSIESSDLDLDLAWWALNGWGTPSARPLTDQSLQPQEHIDWAVVLDFILERRPREIESRWSWILDGDRNHAHHSILWNLLALGYLETGDLRTYEEMREAALIAKVSPSLPAELLCLLEQAGLHLAIQTIEQGGWITSDHLNPSSCSPDPTPNVYPRENDLSLGAWIASMQEGFSLLSLSLPLKAARLFASIAYDELPLLLKAYTLNATALALFLCGDYEASERALTDFHALQSQINASDNPELSTQYTSWLHSIEVTSPPNEPFWNPYFQSETVQEITDQNSQDHLYWVSFRSVLNALKSTNPHAARTPLREALIFSETLEPSHKFLSTLLLAGVCILDGDTMDAQHAIEEVHDLYEKHDLNPNDLQQAQVFFSEVQATNLASKMELIHLATLDPWHDFPSDFPSPSL